MEVKGVVKNMRPVKKAYPQGHSLEGQEWQFLSLEVKDPTLDEFVSCQLRHDDISYAEFVADDGQGGLKLVQDLRGHEISAIVTRLVATGRTMARRVIDSNAERGVGRLENNEFAARVTITDIEDLGKPDYRGKRTA